MKKSLLRMVNRPLGWLGTELVPVWQRQWWCMPAAFQLAGRKYPYFYHAYNCGWPPFATERCVELALADAWLDALAPDSDVVELGAVTPYYWPGRVSAVVDPFDPHARVSHRVSLFDADLNGRAVLSISTLEHVGLGEYGGEKVPGQAVTAVQKILADSPCFLVTVPVGYNSALDDFFFDGSSSLPADVCRRFLVRSADGCWGESCEPSDARRPYDAPGVNKGRSAAALVVVERGNTINLKSQEPASS